MTARGARRAPAPRATTSNAASKAQPRARTQPRAEPTLAVAPHTFARSIVREEAAALTRLAASLDAAFDEAVALIVRCANEGGTVLVTGLGKSGHVGAKISATFASLGITSHSVHPSEAAHGDLGRFRPNDVVIAISNSGETEEVVNLAAILQQDGLPIIAITGQQRQAKAPSSLARLSRVHLPLCLRKEAGAPEFVAPTSSTTATIALGDALALACARARHFTRSDFAKRHPGGTLGGMLRRVTDVMRWRAGGNLPLIDARCTIQQALAQAASAGRRPGALVLIHASTGTLAGIFTDGDLRRLVLASGPGDAMLQRPISSVMTKSPRTLHESATLRDAVLLFRQFRQDEAPVVNDAGKPVGMLDVQDLVALRLIQDDGSER